MKIYGFIPARMAASRFYGKPLHPILGKPMLEHVYLRAKMYTKWSNLLVATCDKEIKDFCLKNNYPFIMTSSKHNRALDRVAEAAFKMNNKIKDNDIVVCVQGDEPMLEPKMIQSVIDPILSDKNKPCTVLAMHIDNEKIWKNPDTVKIIHNEAGKVLYTSRSPIPHNKTGFSKSIKARRIYGIFAFRWKYLDLFVRHKETELEKIEACDSNRILDMKYDQYIAPFPPRKSFSVDSPNDIGLVEKHLRYDKFYRKYR